MHSVIPPVFSPTDWVKKQRDTLHFSVIIYANVSGI